MPPRRPLTDLCLIVVFKQLKPKNQLKASLMSFRSKVLVRAANRRMKTLAISYWVDVEVMKKGINPLSLASKPSMQLTTGKPFSDYPTNTIQLSKWNCLRLKHDTPDIEQIVYIFSAVTDLKLDIRSNAQAESLLDLLIHPQWSDQLSNLIVFNCNLSPELSLRLSTAINRLTALQHLAIIFVHGYDEIPVLNNLTILAQLKVILVEFFESLSVTPFLRSLERYAAENADLQVHLLNGSVNELLSLSEPLRTRVVRFGRFVFPRDNIPLLCSRFSSLTSLRVCLKPIEVEPLFRALSQLPQLVHLELNIVYEFPLEELSPRPITQLPAVRALDLNLKISFHSPLVEWLNLSWTLPNCQAIHLKNFHCRICYVTFYCFGHGLVPVNISALECYRKSSLHKLHRGVHPKKIILAMEELPLEQLHITDQ